MDGYKKSYVAAIFASVRSATEAADFALRSSLLTPDCGNRAANRHRHPEYPTPAQRAEQQPADRRPISPIACAAKPPKCTLLVPALVEVVLLLADGLGRVGSYFKQSRCG
jgi:hypothetical protein